MSVLGAASALERVEERLLGSPVLEGLLARRELGAADVRDLLLIADAVTELISSQERNGSWQDDLGVTAEMVLLLRALEPEPGNATGHALSRAAGWLLGRAGIDGRYGDSCDAVLHARGFCCHFLAGFLSPSGRDASLAGFLLPGGAPFNSDDDARLGLSCIGLRALLACGIRNSTVALHIEGLERVLKVGGARPGQPLSVTSAACALAALASAGSLDAAHAALATVVTQQRADGSWPGGELFHVLDAVLTAHDHGCQTPESMAATNRVAGMLAVTLHENGTWGRAARAQDTYVGWRALRAAVARA